jgi:hypothetical protein
MLFNVIELHQTLHIEKSGVHEHEKRSFRSSKVLSHLVVIFKQGSEAGSYLPNFGDRSPALTLIFDKRVQPSQSHKTAFVWPHGKRLHLVMQSSLKRQEITIREKCTSRNQNRKDSDTPKT